MLLYQVHNGVCSCFFQCMCYYWVCSSLFGVGQNVLFKVPSVRRLLRIPQTPSESQTPFKDLVSAAKARYSLQPKLVTTQAVKDSKDSEVVHLTGTNKPQAGKVLKDSVPKGAMHQTQQQKQPER
jgi:hypothetical protein